MFSKAKFVLSCATLVLMLVAAPAVSADPLEIITETGGFRLLGLGNSGIGTEGHDDFDIFIGAPHAVSNFVDSAGGSFVTMINPLTFLQGFTGLNSEGVYPISFSQLLTVNGQTQQLNMLASLTVGAQDTISILSSEPLFFQFDTFSVSASVLPVTIYGLNDGAYDSLCATFTVEPNCDPVPEPATMVLLGTGLAGLAAKVRRRRKSKASI